MKKIIILAALALITSCSGSSSSNNGILSNKPTTVAIKNTNPGIGTITVMGDSLAAGSGATDVAVKPAGCLSQLENTTVTNHAVPGYTSQQILNTLTAAQADAPKLVFVSSGGNDTMIDNKYPGQYPKEKTLQEMNTLFDQLFQDNNQIVVAYLSLNPPVPYATRLPEITQLAQSKGVIVIDGMDGLWTDASKMSDQIHPNNIGYAIMCSRILDAIKPYYP